jgi:hypothetical protein
MLTGRRLPPLFAVAVLACLAGAAGSVAPAGAASQAARVTTLCGSRAHAAVTAQDGGHYLVKNDNYGGRPECISNRGLRPNFTVTRSAADSYGPEVEAFPFVLYGCSWGLCTTGARLPAPLRALRTASATWYTAGQAARGRWNAAFDIWFGRHRSAARGQATGAELMIWLGAHDYPAGHAKIIRVDHRRWYVVHWVTSHDGKRWTYIQIRAVRRLTHVRHLALLPVIRRVERLGLVSRRWWLVNIEAGFEIWHGGQGLRTTSFSTRVVTDPAG